MSPTQFQIEENRLEDPAKSLKDVMTRETRVLREMLTSMEQEHEAILYDNKEILKSVMTERESLIDLLYKLRNQRIKDIKRLVNIKFPETALEERVNLEMGLNNLKDYIGDEACEILCLKEEIIALLARMNDLSSRNNYLLQNKIAFTKKLINTLHPTENKNAYSGNGQYKKQLQTRTMTIINREV